MSAVTAALVGYQQTRLQLMLDIGALDTDVPKFWLKDHLAAFIPGFCPTICRTMNLRCEPTAGVCVFVWRKKLG